MSKYPEKRKKKPSERERQNGYKAAHSGLSAEEQVAQLFPYWTRLVGKPGHDFIVEIPNGKGKSPHFIEVKSTFSNEPIPTPEE